MKRHRIDVRALAGRGGAIVLMLGLGWIAKADLAGDVKTISQDRFLSRTSVGVEVVQLGQDAKGDREVFSLASADRYMPASNLKLATTSAALQGLGADFRFRTLLVRHGDDLILIGDGDPTFGDAEMLRKSGWDVTTVFEQWTAALRKAGVQSVRDVIIDDSVFDEEFMHPHWTPNNQHLRYSAQVAGMNLNANCVEFYLRAGAGPLVDFRTIPSTTYLNVENRCSIEKGPVSLTRRLGSNDVRLSGRWPGSSDTPVTVTVHDPSMFSATVLAETLAAGGMKVTGQVHRDRTIRSMLAGGKADKTWTLFAMHETPIEQVLLRANKDSMNLYAESLCKRLGFAETGQPGSWQNGVAAVAAHLRKAGVDEKEFHLDDGCGLSRENGISPHAIARLLAFNYHAPSHEMYMGTLAVAGQDGTLEHRFEGADLRGRVLAKSGFIDRVSALSGYLHARNDQWYAFSIMMNDTPAESNWKMKELQEAIVKAINDDLAPGGGR